MSWPTPCQALSSSSMRGVMTGAMYCVMPVGTTWPPLFRKTPPRVGERRDDVFFKRVVAERLRYDHIDGKLVAKLRRVARNEMARFRLVRLQHCRGNARDLGGLEQKYLFSAEFRRHQAEQSRPGPDIGHNRLAGFYDGLQRAKKRLVAHAVGDQRPMIFDAHRSELQVRAADLIKHQRGGDREVERIETAGHGNLDEPRARRRDVDPTAPAPRCP